MKKRIKKWFKHWFIQYVPSSQLIVDNEAKRLTKFITDNYNENEQILIMNKIKENLIDYRNDQIKNKEILIIQEKSDLGRLNKNLERLVA
jgi:ribosomal protein L4